MYGALSSQSTGQGHHSPRPRASLRVRNVAAGVIYNLVFEGDVRRLTGKQLRDHIAHISRVPPDEQQLFIHGRSFEPNDVGAVAGLRENDTVDFIRSTGDVRYHNKFGDVNERNATTSASSVRSSAEVATVSPQVPSRGDSGPVNSFPLRGEGNGRSVTASMASVASASTRRAPSPDRLVSLTSPITGEGDVQGTASDYIAYKHRTALQQQHNSVMLNDSSLPLWTSATTLSSLPYGAWPSGMGVDAESPQPRIPERLFSYPTQGSVPTSASSIAHPQSSRFQEFPSRPSASHSDHQRHVSYALSSPPLPLPPRSYDAHFSPHYLNAPPPLTSYPGWMEHRGASAAPSNGLNHSHYEDRRINFVEQRARGSSPLQQQQPYRPLFVSSASHASASAPVSASAVHGAVIRADELETILDEQNHVWRMEAYRFHTEREKRLIALQHRQRELTLESARYDEEVADMERLLARERQKLAELHATMVRNATDFHLDQGNGSQEKLIATEGAPHAIPTYPSAVHRYRAHSHMYHGTDAVPYPPTSVAGSVSVMEEEVIADV